LLAYDEGCSFDQRPSGFADDLVSTNLTEQGSGYLWARTLEIGSQDAYVGIGSRMTLQLVKPRLHELRRIRVVANYQFGTGASKAFPKTIKITRSPNTHRIRHIYTDSELLATYRPRDGLLALSVSGGEALREIFKAPKLRVKVVAGVEEFIKKGGNVFCKHVQDVDPELRPAEEVLVVDEKDHLLAVGRSFFNAEEMLSFKIGVAVKVRHGIES
jgi:predicted RNA-binding protein (TIGR00451 family)